MNKLIVTILLASAFPILSSAKEEPGFHHPGECGCKPYEDNTWYAYYWDGDSWDYVGGPFNQLSECVKSTKFDLDLKDLCKRK